MVHFLSLKWFWRGYFGLGGAEICVFIDKDVERATRRFEDAIHNSNRADMTIKELGANDHGRN